MQELIKRRRSIREYTDEPVSGTDVQALLEAAMAAPSAHNLQPWEFIVVREKDLHHRLAETHQWSGMCADASVVFVVCGQVHRSPFWVEDTCAATENLLLAATGRGLGAVWVGIYPTERSEEYVRKVLDIPDELRILCLVPVGHPAESKSPRTQYDESRVHYDRYQKGRNS